MPTLTADPDDITEELDSREDVDELTEEMFDLKREIMQRERKVEKRTQPLEEEIAQIEEEIEEIESRHEDYLQRRREALQARKEAIIEWARDHDEAVLQGVDGRTYANAFAEVSFTRKSFTFEWVDKDTVLEELKALGRDDLVRRTEKVPYKSDLKKEPDLVRRIEGVEPQEEHDVVDVELKIG